MSDESGESQIQSGENKDKASNQGNQSDCNVSPPKVGAEPTPPTHLPESVDNPDKTTHEKPSWCEKGTFWLEVAGVLGLTFYCWINWREWQTFDSERQIMEKEVKASTASEITAQRAWVYVNHVTGQASSDRSTGNFLTIFQNTGRTPALNFQSFVSFESDTNLIPINDPRPSGLVANGVIAPNASGAMETRPIGYEKLASSNKAMGYVFGTIWYDDIYGNHHWNQFCFFVRADIMNPQSLDAIPVGFHNSCDDIENAKKQ